MSLAARVRSPVFALASLAAFAGCSFARPPFTRPQGGAELADPRQATVVFLWPETICDPAGYFTLATADGTFLGNIARDSRLSVSLPAGENTVVAWNETTEAVTGWTRREIVPVLHTNLREGRSYYVRMTLGEWNATGPADEETFSTRGKQYGRGPCLRTPESATSAMTILSPDSKEWRQLPAWMANLDELLPDRPAGQAWLDANRTSLETHVAVARERFSALRPEAKKLATIEPTDGTP